MVILRTSALLLLLLAAACVGNRPLFQVADPGAQHALLYLYRPYDMSNLMLSPAIHVNDEVVQLGNGEYRALALVPGDYKVRLAAVEGYTVASDKGLVALAGRVHFLRLDTSMKMQTGTRYSAYQRTFRLTEVTRVQALEQLAGLKDAAQQDAMECSACTLEQVPENEDDVRFSTDKTDNPFAR